jgi:DNA gyrase subunit A
MAVRFPESQVRQMGRAARGVRGITLRKGDALVSMVAPRRGSKLLIVTEGGYGKRGDIEDYRMTRRGGVGVIALRVTEKTGNLVTMKEVLDDDEIVLISEEGMVIRQKVSDIKVIGRATQGVKLIQLGKGDRFIDVARVVPEEEGAGTEEAEEK